MNNERKAIENELPESCMPIAFAKSNMLRAMLWRSEAGCHFTILRFNPETGIADNVFQPQDAEDLARLTVVMSYAMHLDSSVDSDLSDDLGCLAHCLGQPLGIELDRLRSHSKTMQ